MQCKDAFELLNNQGAYRQMSLEQRKAMVAQLECPVARAHGNKLIETGRDLDHPTRPFVMLSCAFADENGPENGFFRDRLCTAQGGEICNQNGGVGDREEGMALWIQGRK